MTNKHNKSQDKIATSIPKSKKQPLKSGKVKGPMGIGEKQKPSIRATVKEPAKAKVSHGQDPDVSTVSAGSAMKKQERNTSRLSPAPSWNDRLPERTSKKSEALQVMETKRKRKEAQRQHDMTSGDPINLSQTTQTEMQEKEQTTHTDHNTNNPKYNSNYKKESDKSTQEKNASISKETGDLGAKKMSRKKHVKGISAEEKLKLDNVSPSQELEDRVTQNAKGLWEALDPGEQTKDELAKILLKVIPTNQQLAASTPSKEELKAIAERISDIFDRDANMDEILALIPNEKIRKQVRALILRARNAEL